MRVSKVWKGCVAAFGAAAAVAVACGTFTQAGAAEAEYKIYPTPHEVAYGQGVVDFEGTVNTIVGDGIDGYTEDRLDEVLELAGVTAAPADAASDDGEGIEILVGVEGSGDAADAYVTEGPSADLFTKTDAYYLAIEPASGDAPDRIVVLGRDTDSAFYGLSTLYQILQQDTDGDVAALTVSDWADVETRGFIEGYYGNPWSTEDRCELMRWGGYYKLNAYIYAPKDDPKRGHRRPLRGRQRLQVPLHLRAAPVHVRRPRVRRHLRAGPRRPQGQVPPGHRRRLPPDHALRGRRVGPGLHELPPSPE